MSTNKCNHDCNKDTCPFVQDANNANRYVCLKCGLTQNVTDDEPKSSLWIVFLLIGLLLVVNQKPPKKTQIDNPSGTQAAVKLSHKI
jgi:ribosomal protein S27AE